MPCDYDYRQADERRRENAKKRKEREKKREEEYKKLKDELKKKRAKIAKQGNKVSIEGWSSRGDWCDECVIRRMRQSSDFEIRQLVNRAVPTMEGITFGHEHTS
jgi:hypothetical protein